MEVGFFPGTQRLRYPRYPCPAERGTRFTRPDWAKETQTFSGTNQKPERRRPFGTGLVRHCSQRLFSPFFTFLPAIFSLPFRLSPAPTIIAPGSPRMEVSQLEREFKFAIIFRRRSRGDSLFQAFYYLNAWNGLQRRKEWICECQGIF